MRFFPPTQATEWRPKVADGETVGLNFKINKAPAGAKEKIGGWVFCRPIRGWEFFCGNLPTVSPWATICRASGAIFAALVLFFAVGATAQTNTLSDAEIQGRQLAQQLCNARPTENFTNTGILRILGKNGISTNIEISCKTIALSNGWQNIYEIVITNFAADGNHAGCFLKGSIFVNHIQNQTNNYESDLIISNSLNKKALGFPSLKIQSLFSSFAQSDFCFTDLGLEFFHWPQQKVLPKTTNLKRGRDYTLLESTNPNPPTNGYSRVLAWIDKESGGILEAEAYDFNGKLLKDFAPKSFKKVNGQWELQEMEIRNVQTGSRSRLEFDLKK